jgi:hypothetical protein
MKQPIFKLSLMVAIFFFAGIESNGQPIPEEYKKGTISEQLNQLETHTRIYDNYRAIREDIFQVTSKNIKDTLASANKKIKSFTLEIATLKSQIDTINKNLETTKSSLEKMAMSKNSIRVLGFEVNKTKYNSLMWSIIGIIVFLLVFGYLIFKKNRSTTLKTKLELIDLQKQFEDYKQKMRLEHENLTMMHFNEIKKLKDESSKR